MTTRRTWVVGPLLLLAGLALGLVLAGPAGASEPGPAYPPGAGADDVVRAGGEPAPAGAADDGGTAGHDPAAASDGAGGGSDPAGDGTEVGEPATEDRPDAPGEDEADDEVAADGEEVSQDAAPRADESRIGPILVVIGTAVLLGGAVVAIARRI